MQIILGSQSPRRRELLSDIIGESRLKVIPPSSDDEPGFTGLSELEEIEERLRLVVQCKARDVVGQIQNFPESEDFCVICADTIVVATDTVGDWAVLGKPPVDNWRSVVRDWFRTHYNGRPHEVWSGVRIETPAGVEEFVVKTQVRMCDLTEDLIDWYISTEESIGKAGGYGIQGRAAVLINGLDGSLSNVIGLPVVEVVNSLQRLGVTLSKPQR